jgi:hypothetical protein
MFHSVTLYYFSELVFYDIRSWVKLNLTEYRLLLLM